VASELIAAFPVGEKAHNSPDPDRCRTGAALRARRIRATMRLSSRIAFPDIPMNNLVVQGVAAVVALALYFLPSLIADRRKRYDLLTIALFNAVVGWTVFGWLLALYWALQPNPPKNVAGEIVQSRKLISMRTFSSKLAERVRLRSSRNSTRERSSK
jgi:hypothetical protein